MAAPKMKLKLLVDKNAKKVVFAEADNNVIDILICLRLSFPLGTAVNPLKEISMVGSLGNLYESIENLPDAYWQPYHSKKSVLNLMLSDLGSSSRQLYTCPSYHAYVADVPILLCPTCNQKPTIELKYVSPLSPKNFEGGFVKELVTYMVMDNLEFRPMSSKDFVTLFNNLRAEKEVTELKEMVVDFGKDEALKLLKTSRECKTVLTSVFLGNIGE